MQGVLLAPPIDACLRPIFGGRKIIVNDSPRNIVILQVSQDKPGAKCPSLKGSLGLKKQAILFTVYCFCIVYFLDVCSFQNKTSNLDLVTKVAKGCINEVLA
jgi:hypothetical protein